MNAPAVNETCRASGNLRGVSRVALLVVLWAAGSVAEARADSSCPVDLPGEVSAVEHLLARGDPAGAVDRATDLSMRCPGHPVAIRLTAHTLLAVGDAAEARYRLQRYLDQNPHDCQTWSWLAWVALEMRDPVGAWLALAAAGCPDTPTETARWALIEALVAHQVHDPDGVRTALHTIRPSTVLWPEDVRLLAYLRTTLDRRWQWPWQATIELSTGATSNALAGSPTDTAGDGVSSSLARVNARTVLFGPQTGPVAPFGEATVRGHGLADTSARDLSYLEFSGRVGALLRLGAARATVAVRRDALHLNRPRDSRLFTALRGELDLELPGGAVVFGGGGRREFDDLWRTRREFDLGAARVMRLGGQPVTFALAGRRFEGQEPVYDQRGGTFTTVTHFRPAPRWIVRASALISRDVYPRSDTWQGLIAFGSNVGRRDTTARVSVGAWRELPGGCQAGIGYEYARRWSTIQSGLLGTFAYREHRLVATLRFDAVADPWRHTAAPAGHVALDWGLSAPIPGLGDERIRDLLRLDEEIRSDCPVCP